MEQCCLLCSLPAFSHFPCYPQANWVLLVLIPGWGGLCTFQDPVSLSNKFSGEAESLSQCLSPHRFFQSEVLRLYFSVLEPWVLQSTFLPSCSSWFMHTQMWDLLLCQPLFCHETSLPCLSISAPPTSVDEYFFFNFWVLRLPYSLIFCQLWLFFVFKFVVVLLLVV